MHLTLNQTNNPQAGSRLLNLPPELRNRIYEYCLKSEYVRDIYKVSTPWTINITDRPKPPGLLFTCKQVRSETTKIWYLANEFLVEIENYDATALVAWEKWSRQIHETLGARPKIGLDGMLYANWKNLKQWCRLVWAGEVPFPDLIIPEADTAVLVSSLRIARECQRQPWEKCETTLEGFRSVAGDTDSDWLDDGENTEVWRMCE